MFVALNPLTDKMEFDGLILRAAIENRIHTNKNVDDIITENSW